MEILKDKNITLKAKGLYYMINTLISSDEPFSKNSLYDMANNGKKSIDGAWKELKDNGYLKIEKVNVKGKFIYKYSLLK